jgi:protein-disulfide isomerase
MRARLLALAAALSLSAAQAAVTPAQAAQAQAPKPAAAAVAPAAPAVALPNKWNGDDYVIGSSKAPVTLVEYASVACPHCARFDAQVFPTLKAKYIDTGKVRFIYREFLVGDESMVQVAAIGFLLARCAGHDKYFNVVEQVYRAQPEIFTGKDVKGVFVRIAKDNGLSEAQLDACIEDKAAQTALNARAEHAEKVDKIDSTPTLVADGKKLVQAPGKEWDVAMLTSQLDPLLKRAKK